MKRAVWWLPTLAVAVLLIGAPAAAWAESPGDVFGVVKAPSFDQAKAKSMAWLKEEAKADAITLKKAEDLWNTPSDLSILDRVVATLMLGDQEAQELMEAARDPEVPPPTQVPAIIVNSSKSLFLRANLGLAFAKQMANRKVYEESLATLRAFKAEDTVDPSTYFFYRAVSANKLRFKPEAVEHVDKLMANVVDIPERYAVVAALMRLEMSQWKDADLGDIARRMKEVEDRLEIARGGKTTQVKQEEIVKMLAKLIEDLEKECGACQGSSGGGPPRGTRSSGPAQDSAPAQGEGEGNVDTKALVRDLKLWGKLPEKDRIKAFEAIKKEYPPHVAEAIRGYLIKGGMIPADR